MTNNLELIRGINRAGNLREVIGIEQRYHRRIWRHSTIAGGDISKRAAISMGARAMQGIGSNLWSFSKLLIVYTDILFSIPYRVEFQSKLA